MSLESIRALVTELAAIPGRGAATAGEKRAAEIMRAAFEQLGLETTAQTFRAPKILGEPVALFLAVAIGGTAIGFWRPLAGAAAVALMLWILERMFNVQGALWTHFTRRGESVNVIGKRLTPGAKRTLVFSAHLDAGQTGLMFHPRVKRLFARLQKDPQSVQGPMYTPAMILLVAAVVLLARACGAHGGWLDALHLTVLGLQAVSLLVTVQWMRSPVVPGAIDNASGLAAMVEAARRLTGEPLCETNVYLVATGAEETGMIGMKHFYATHAAELAGPQTYFFNFESVGGGELRAVEEEGELGRFRYPPFLVGFAQYVAQREGLGPLPTVNLLAGTDTVVTAKHGRPTLCLIALEEHGAPPNYHELADTADRVDCAVTQRAAELAVAVARRLEREGL